MNKVKKGLLFLAIISFALITLTGCGNKKLIATKTTTVSGMSYDERIEVTFKGNNADKVVWELTFSEEELAKSYVSYFKSMYDIDIKQDGKKVVMTLDSDSFAKIAGDDNFDASYKQMKEDFESEGYTIEK